MSVTGRERAIRPLAVGCANCLHVGGDRGLKTVSVFASATNHRRDPWSYFRDVLDYQAPRSAGDGLSDFAAEYAL